MLLFFFVKIYVVIRGLCEFGSSEGSIMATMCQVINTCDSYDDDMFRHTYCQRSKSLFNNVNITLYFVLKMKFI